MMAGQFRVTQARAAQGVLCDIGRTARRRSATHGSDNKIVHNRIHSSTRQCATWVLSTAPAVVFECMFVQLCVLTYLLLFNEYSCSILE
jgi:hypothetical protein